VAPGAYRLQLLAGVALRRDRYDIGDPMFADREEQGDELAHSSVERVHRFCGHTGSISRRSAITPDLLRDHAGCVGCRHHRRQVLVGVLAGGNSVKASL